MSRCQQFWVSETIELGKSHHHDPCCVQPSSAGGDVWKIESSVSKLQISQYLVPGTKLQGQFVPNIMPNRSSPDQPQHTLEVYWGNPPAQILQCPAEIFIMPLCSSDQHQQTLKVRVRRDRITRQSCRHWHCKPSSKSDTTMLTLSAGQESQHQHHYDDANIQTKMLKPTAAQKQQQKQEQSKTNPYTNNSVNRLTASGSQFHTGVIVATFDIGSYAVMVRDCPAPVPSDSATVQPTYLFSTALAYERTANFQ